MSEKEPESLLKQVYSYSQVGDALKIAQPKRWIILGSILFLFGSALIWAFLGRIPTEVAGKMVALHPDALIMVQSKGEGIMESVLVKEGDTVAKGKILGRIYNPVQRAIVYKIRTERDKLLDQEKEVGLVQNNLNIRERLFHEGLIARTVVDSTQIDLIGKKIALNETAGTIINLFAELEKSSQYWVRVPKNADDPKSYEVLNVVENLLSNFYAPEDVKVLEILIKDQEHVDANQQLFWLERIQKTAEPLLFYAAMPVDQGSKARPGMKVYLEPQNVNNQEYGKLIGVIKEVSSFAASEKEILKIVKNPQVAKYLMEDGKPVTLAIIEGVNDSSTISQFAWTSKSGPPFKIQAGTVGVVKIIVEEQPPISYLIPLWKIYPY